MPGLIVFDRSRQIVRFLMCLHRKVFFLNDNKKSFLLTGCIFEKYEVFLVSFY